MDRRGFLKVVGAVVGFPYVLPSRVFGAEGTAPSNRIVIGCIGLGIQGMGNMRAFLQQGDVQVAAVCDVRESKRQSGKELVDRHYGDNGCAVYNDFRELTARKDIDAIMMAVPDHWHSLVG